VSAVVICGGMLSSQVVVIISRDEVGPKITTKVDGVPTALQQHHQRGAIFQVWSQTDTWAQLQSCSQVWGNAYSAAM
jgi:hypothetical protein